MAAEFAAGPTPAVLRTLGAAIVTGYSIDSRTIQPGDLFFAIHGERFDGHDFVEAVIEAGRSRPSLREPNSNAIRALPSASACCWWTIRWQPCSGWRLPCVAIGESASSALPAAPEKPPPRKRLRRCWSRVSGCTSRTET